MRPYAYDRDGNPLTLEEWSALHGDHDYRRVDQTEVNGYNVSTVWLGLPQGFWQGYEAPLIFETMIFKDGDLQDLYCDRYSTEAEAIAGHAAAIMVAEAGGLEDI